LFCTLYSKLMANVGISRLLSHFPPSTESLHFIDSVLNGSRMSSQKFVSK
jgi:hypothetical protein